MYNVEVSCDDQRTWSKVYGPVTKTQAVEELREIEDRQASGIDVRIVPA